MVVILLAAAIGAIIGGTTARRRKGGLADILRYGFVYGLIFALAGLFATLIIDRALR